MIYDISIPITPEMHVWPGDVNAEITSASRISQGAGSNVSILRFSTHVGTHVDPPLHFIEGGNTVDELPLDLLIGECLVHKVDSPSVITIADVEGVPAGTERIIFKTRNSDLWRKPGFQYDYVYLDPDAAEWLVKRGIRLVGTDYLSVDKMKSGHLTHTCLLQAGVVIVEGLDCTGVPEGMYTLACLPLRIKGGDGAPARVILMK
jgi:arylformamidase